MSGYTDTEIETAVSSFVRSSIKTERDPLGPLSEDNTFAEVREFASSTLVFDPSSIFYLLSLAANRVNQDVLLMVTYLDDLIEAIDEMDGLSTKVTKTALLDDAASALLDAERLLLDPGALSDRQISRYNRALNQFTEASLSPNVRALTGNGFPNTYKIVRPPQEAQSAIKSNISSIRVLHQTVLEEAAQLAVAFSEFLAADLPKVAVQQSITKVRTDLRTLKNQFDAAATSDDAIGMTRDAFLRIRSGQAVVENLSSLSDPSDARMLGTSATSDRAQAAYSSDSSSSTPARIETSISAPFLIEPGVSDYVSLVADGSVGVALTLSPPDPAEVVGAVGGPFSIHSAQKANLTGTQSGPLTIPAIPDNVCTVYVDGIEYRSILTPGSTTTLAVAAAIGASVRTDGQSGTLSSVLDVTIDGSAPSPNGKLYLEHLTAGDHSIVIGDQTALNAVLGFTNSQDSDDLISTQGVDGNDEISFLLDETSSVVVSLTTGSSVSSAQVAADIAAASTLCDSFVRAVPVLPSGSEDVVVVRSTSYGEGSRVALDPQNATHRSAMVTLGFLEGQLGSSFYLSLDSLYDEFVGSGVEVEKSLSSLQSGLDGETVLVGSDYKLRLPTGTVTASLTVNDKLLLESGENAGYYGISSISLGGAFDEITVSRPFRTVTGSGSTGQSWDFRRDRLVIKSISLSTISSIEVLAASANAVLGLTVGKTYGTTSGVRVKDSGKDQSFERNDVKVNDTLTLTGPTYTSVHNITAVSQDGYQLEVTPEVSDDLLGHTYQIDSSGASSYLQFISDLETWSSSLNASSFDANTLELERRLNPLLSNLNPSIALINDARSSANALRALYTGSGGIQEILESFDVERVERIDALLNMLKERGLLRAQDMLLLGQMSSFFAVNKDSASYGGNLLEKMRSIAQNDVAVTTSTSEDHVDSRLTGSYEETDPAFDFSDADDESGRDEVDDIPDLDSEEDIFNQLP